jgi:serine/threonine protein kinase
MALGTLGKYELLEKIAEGGMGELFRARSTGPGDFERIVAVKRIRASMVQEERSRQMFIEEAKIASFVSHPNLVHLYDFGGDGDSLYLVMELVEGRDLAKIQSRCRQNRDPLRIPLAVRIAAQVAEGLDYLHRLSHRGQPLQLVHRDVSPQNVLVSFDGVVKLTDFGIARMHRTEPVTQVGVLKGKMGYMTPEQLSEVPVDGRADIFCLGIVLWEMLTGGRLFQGSSDAQILEQVLHKRIPLPSTLNVDVPRALDRIVMRALERDRTRRFDRAGDMAHALNALEGFVATDLELGQELRRYFPDEATLLPSAATPEPRTESVSTSLDRPEPAAPATTAREGGAAVPARQPPPAPPATVEKAIRPKPVASRSYAWAALAVPLVALAGLALLWVPKPAGRSTPLPKEPTDPTSGLAAAQAAIDAGTAGTAVTPGLAVADAVPRLPLAIPEVATPTPPPTAGAKPTPVAPRPRRATPERLPAVIRAANVKPWAEVVVDGTYLGYTAGSWKVAPGHHHLLLRNGTAGIEREFDMEFPSGVELLIRGSLRTLQPEFVR